MRETFENIDELLTRILNDTAEREEVRRFGEWIRQEENKAYFETFKKVWHLSSGVQCDDRSVEAGWQDYKRFIISSRKKEIPFLLRKTWKYASAIVVLVSTYWFFVQERTKEEIVNVAEYVDISMENANGVTLFLADGQAVNVSDSREQEIRDQEGEVRIRRETGKGLVYESSDVQVPEKEVMNEVVVPGGERMSIVLSDGTRVWLNSESAIRYPARFGNGKRVVTVKGNVYFEVEKDVDRPFVVVMKDMVTEVLGTSFEVNTYGDHNRIFMTLVEGTVRVKAGGNSVVAQPDERITFDLTSGKMNAETVDAAGEVVWKDGLLVVRNEPFSDVTRKLERWFGVSVQDLSTRGNDLLFSGVFERGDVETALETICANLNINYTIDGKQVVLKD
ncbi:MAG: FecR domain-containing protein [Odoribacter sp.]|nr:FecR domain-containing protein [Odoribacter sp.]